MCGECLQLFAGLSELVFHYVPAPIAHFVPFEVRTIYMHGRVRSFAAFRHVALVAVFGMETIIHITVEVFRAVNQGPAPMKTPSTNHSGP